jgi:hypothetical protein
MKKTFLKVMSGLVAVCLSSWLFAADSKPDAEVAELKRKVAQLEERLARMEKKLSSAPPIIITPAPHGPQTSSGVEGQPHGKIWGEWEVNGWKYYAIPLGAGSRSGESGRNVNRE